MERLRINKFIVIDEADIEIKDVNIIIGRQSSGKSIIAKLLYYFKEYPSKVYEIVQVDIGKRDFDREMIQRFYEIFPPESWGGESFKIEYTYNNSSITITRNKDKNTIELEYSDDLKKLIQSYKTIIRNSMNGNGINLKELKFEREDLIEEKFISKLKNIHTGKHFANEQVFIPASRSFFSVLQSSIFSFLSTNSSLDPFLKEFGSIYEHFKHMNQILDKRPNSKSQRYDDLISEIIDCKYHKIKGKEYLINDKRKTPIRLASSGQQEVLPLLIILKTLNRTRLSAYNGNSIYIEEPEAHLFPEAQKEIVDLIISTYNDAKYPSQFFITTHSPYVLATINNLIMANEISDKIKKKSDQKIEYLNNYTKLSYDLVSAYTIVNGKVITMLNNELRLIDQTILDNASNIISNEFDILLELGEEYGVL